MRRKTKATAPPPPRKQGKAKGAVGLLVTIARSGIPIKTAQAPTLPNMTARERQVLDALLRGCLDVTIAAELGVSHSRVRKIISSLFDKFAAPSRLHLCISYLRRIGAMPVLTHRQGERVC